MIFSTDRAYPRAGSFPHKIRVSMKKNGQSYLGIDNSSFFTLNPSLNQFLSV
jgi:hypothetical protein